MHLSWLKEPSPRWDADKQRIIGDAPAGSFDPVYRALPLDALAPGQWWRVEGEGETLGYGWLDVVWGDAEILLATAESKQRHGVGSFILEHLMEEARLLGLHHLYNVVRPAHPDATRLTRWLMKRGFRQGESGRLLLSTPGLAPPPKK